MATSGDNCSLALTPDPAPVPAVAVAVAASLLSLLPISGSVFFRLADASLSFIRLKMAANEGNRFDFLLQLSAAFTGTFSSTSEAAAVVAVVAVEVAFTSALSVSLLFCATDPGRHPNMAKEDDICCIFFGFVQSSNSNTVFDVGVIHLVAVMVVVNVVEMVNVVTKVRRVGILLENQDDARGV